MNTTAQKPTTVYTFTTCRRCGYIIAAEEELCQACKQEEYKNNNKLF